MELFEGFILRFNNLFKDNFKNKILSLLFLND